ncbi:MAG: DUF2007 domain-containing protein [Deltaproteobacteria bacterium]|nr:DUF2007 domain-containing protein [Deltaproteobacteria bacterium]
MPERIAWESCYATPVEAEAHVVKGFLEQYGVPCVLDSNRFGAQPLTFCALGQVRVLVPSDWLRVARGLIKGRGERRGRILPGRQHG